MAEEKTVVINIKKDLLKRAVWKRSKNASFLLREKLEKLSRNGEVKIDQKLNEAIWARGIRKTKTHVKVKIKKLDNGSIEAYPAE